MNDEPKPIEAVEGTTTTAETAERSPGADDISSRWDDKEQLRRELRAEASVDEKARTVELSFASETPVTRYDFRKDKEYREVLSCNAPDVDLSRLNDAHPLLLNHDPYDQIGVVISSRVDSDKKCRATVKFSKSQRGDEIWQDVKDGIRRLVSVGYRRIKEVGSEIVDGMETVRFSWQPYEVSIVSVPADASVGIGRNKTPEANRRIEIMPEENKPAAVPSYQKEAAEIIAVAKNLRGKVENIDELASQAITEGKSLAEFRAIALTKLPEVKPMEKPLLSEVKPADWQRYSLTRAIKGQLENKLTGFEREMSDEVALKTGERAQGFWVPQEAFARNFIAGTGTLGGMVVDTQNLGDQFIELLRNKAKVAAMGARILNLNGPVTIPRANAAGTANWVAETVAATLSTGNFTQMTLTPYAVSAFQQYSKQLLMTSNPSIDSLIRDDIMNIIALAIDRAALHGPGYGQPTGIAGTTGINTVSVAYLSAAGLTTSLYPFLVSLETEIATDNADTGSIGYLMRPKERGACKTTAQFASTGIKIWEPGNTVNGYRAEVTNQIAGNLTHGTATTIATAVFFGNWNDILIGQFAGGATDLVVDPYTLAVNGAVRIIARKWVDVGVRHPESFCLGVGVIA